MNQLIPTITGEIAGAQQTLCNARELHAFLGVGRDFPTWIKDRVEQYGFTEGEDFSPVLGKTSSSLFGGRPKTEYLLSLDMAKELAMLENTERGRQARRYFIQMEKAALLEVPAFLRRPDLPMPGQVEALQIARLKAALRATHPVWGKLARYAEMGLTPTEMGKLIGKSPDAVGKHLQRMAKAGLIERKSNLPALRQGDLFATGA